jgi:hypothetical protein
VGFGVIEEGESGDEEVKVFAMVVFDTEVIHHQRKDNVAGDVAEETGGGGLVEAVGGKMGEKTVRITHEEGLWGAVEFTAA